MTRPVDTPGAAGEPEGSAPGGASTLPVCAWCKRVRDDEGAWAEEERGRARGDEARRSHGLCPECFARLSR